jgi:hypothetical protein
VQRAAGPSFAAIAVARARLRERKLGIEELLSLHVAVRLAHAREACLHELLGAERPVAYRPRRVRRRQPVELRGFHAGS